MNAEGAGDFGDGSSFLQQPSGELQLLFVHLLRAPEANATLPGVDSTSTSAFPDEVALELGDAGEDGHTLVLGAGALCGSSDDGFPAPAFVVALAAAFRSIAEGLNR